MMARSLSGYKPKETLMYAQSNALLRCFLARPSPIDFDMSRVLAAGRLALHLDITHIKASLYH